MSEIIGRVAVFVVIVAVVGIIDLAIGILIKQTER